MNAIETSYDATPLQQGMLLNMLRETGRRVDIEQVAFALAEPVVTVFRDLR